MNPLSFIKILVQNALDRTKALLLQTTDSATANTQTTLQSSQTADRVLNLPDVSGTLVERDAVETLTNKTLIGAVIDGDLNTITNINATGVKVNAISGMPGIDNVQTALEQHQLDIEALETSGSALQTEVDAIKVVNAAQQVEIDAIEVVNTNQQAEIDAAQIDITDLQGQVGILEQSSRSPFIVSDASLFVSTGTSLTSQVVNDSTIILNALSLGGTHEIYTPFTPSSSANLGSIVLEAKKNDVYNGNIHIKIYNSSGGAPIGGALTVSSDINASAISTSTFNSYNFTFDGTLALVSGTTYIMEISSDDSTGNASVEFSSGTFGVNIYLVYNVLSSSGGGAFALNFDDDLFLSINGLAYADNTILQSQSPVSLPNTFDVAYVVPNLATGGPALAVSVTTINNVPSNGYVIASRDSSSDVTISATRISGTGLPSKLNTSKPSLSKNYGVVSDSRGNLVSSTTTSTELGYLSGATSNIQSQIDTITSTVPALGDGHIFVGDASNQAADVPVSGELSITNTGAVTLDNDSVISKTLTGFTSMVGTITSSDTLLTAIEKLDANSSFSTWGTIDGTLSDQFDLQTALDEKVTAQVDKVRVTTVAPITLSGLQTIDGVSLVANDPVLVKDQVSTVDNGVYLVQSGAWTPVTNMYGGNIYYVSSGTVNAATSWVVTGKTGNILIGTDATSVFSVGSSGGGALKANVTLDNLGTVAFNADLIPDVNGTRDIGSSTKRISTGYFNTANVHSSLGVFNSSSANRGQVLADSTLPSGTGAALGIRSTLTSNIGVYTADQGDASTNSPDIRIESGNATGTTSNSGNLVVQTGTATGTRGSVDISASALSLKGQTPLKFKDADSSNFVALKAPATVTTDVTWTLPGADGSTSQVLTTDGSGTLSWSTPSSGTGDVVGPASSTNNGFVRFDGTTGKLIKNSPAAISDSDVDALANIHLTKLEAVNASRALVSNGLGFIAASTTTTTELGLLAGVTAPLATTTGTQTLTNKTLTAPIIDVVALTEQASTPATPAAGTKKFYAKNDGKVYTLNSTGAEVEVGSGSSTGGNVNFITNGMAETSTTGWAAYADAAGTRPVDGTGGSPAVTITRSTTSPLSGVGSFLLTKDAANRQGQGVSYDFTIDEARKGKSLQISFDYILASGTFAAGSDTTDGDVIAYIFDITNNLLIEPSNIKMFSSSTSLSDKFNGTFQSSSNSTSYRLILHCASTSASAYALRFDNVKVSPNVYTYGTPITDWTSYTPTGSFTTNTTYQGQWRRVGSNVEVQTKLTFTGTPNAPIDFTIDMPPQAPIGTKQISNVIGFGRMEDVGIARYGVQALVNSSSSIVIRSLNASTSTLSDATVNNTAPFTVGTSDVFDITVTYIVDAWSSSVRMSDGYEGRNVTAYATKTASQSVPNAASTTLIFNTTVSDTVGGYDPVTGIYTVKTSGTYRFNSSVEFGSSGTGYREVVLIKNNSVSYQMGFQSITGAGTGSIVVGISPPLECIAGDFFKINVNQTSGGALTVAPSGAQYTYFGIEKRATPQTIGETPQAVFTGDSGSGGIKGLVPAPAAGDAALGKVLSAAGTWAQAASSANFISTPNSVTGWTTFNDNAIAIGGTADTVNDFIQGFAGTLAGLTVGQRVRYSTTGTAIGGLTNNTDYFVHTLVSVNSVKLAATAGGALIDLTSTGSGNVTLSPYQPIDGTGGTAAVLSIANTATTPLAANTTTSILLTKTAAVGLGEGYSYDFTINEAAKTQSNVISFSYAVPSGTFSAGSDSSTGDLTVWIFDRTNNVLIQPSSYKLLSSSALADTFQGSFNPNTTSTSYRLIVFQTTASASAYTFKTGSNTVWPSKVTTGTPVTDWATFPMVITATTTNPTKGSSLSTDSAKWRRVGDSMEISYNYYSNVSGGTTGNGQYYFNLPSGYTIDANKMFINGDKHLGVCGVASGYAAAPYSGYTIAATPNAISVVLSSDVAATNSVSSTFFSLNNLPLTINFTAKVPIVGWSSSVRLSDGYEGREISLIASGSAALTTSNATILYTTKEKDTTNSYNAATGEFTVPTSGEYDVSAGIRLQSAATAVNNSTVLALYKNGVVHRYIFDIRTQTTAAFIRVLFGSLNKVPCIAGDKLKIQLLSDFSVSVDTGLPEFNYFMVGKISTPQTIAQSGNGTQPIVFAYSSISTNVVTNKVLADATSGAQTITLHTAVGNSGQTVLVKKTDGTANTVTLATSASQLIDQTTTKVMTLQDQYIEVTSDGSNWKITNFSTAGEILRSFASISSGTGNSSAFIDLTSLSIKAGAWSVAATGTFERGGGAFTDLSVGVSSSSGNTGAGLTTGDNYLRISGAAEDNLAISIPAFQITLGTSITYYLKLRAVFTIASGNAAGRLTATRLAF